MAQGRADQLPAEAVRVEPPLLEVWGFKVGAVSKRSLVIASWVCVAEKYGNRAFADFEIWTGLGLKV